MYLEQAILCRVEELCQKRGISLEEFSATSGVDLSRCDTAVNAGREETTIDTINQICGTLNVCATDFFNSDLFRNLKRK